MTRLAIVGLGNPGPEYADTFHNVGAAFVERLAEAGEASWKRLDHVSYAVAGDRVLARTEGYMNESGRGVRELVEYLKLHDAALVLAHDDTDIPLGSTKLVRGGGSGGHKGVISVTEHLGTPEVWRLKIGARPERFAGSPHIKAESFVLNRIGEDERALLAKGFAEAERLLGGLEGA